MLDRLVASDRAGSVLGGTPGAALSVTVHGLLIVGAVLATRAAPPPPDTRRSADTIPIFVPDGPAPREIGGDAGLPGLPVIDEGVLDGIAEVVGPLTFDVPVGIAAPDADAVHTSRRARSGREAAWPWARPGGGDPSAPILATVADEAPELLTSPAPVYPAMLRDAGIEGTVVIEMVVDEEGRPEAATVRVLSSGPPAFEAAARRVVLGARYRPGRWRGRPVRVLIRQPVEFRLSGR